MTPLQRLLLCPIALLLPAAWSSAAIAVDPEQLRGRWCLSAVSAVDGDRARSIGREWTFLRGGLLRVQSESRSDVRMRVGYTLSDRRLVVDELDLRLDIERISDQRMAALGRDGKLRYHFKRGTCSESDGDTGPDPDSGSTAGNGDNRPVR